MSDLDRMWEALTQYQPYADQDGYGQTWLVMCKQKTCRAAANASAYSTAAAAAACAAAETATALEAAYWSGLAITRIETELKERNHE